MPVQNVPPRKGWAARLFQRHPALKRRRMRKKMRIRRQRGFYRAPCRPALAEGE